jgi:hypothetical protein
LRAKRAYEEGERQFRDKERRDAETKAKRQAEMELARKTQALEKERRLAE